MLSLVYFPSFCSVNMYLNKEILYSNTYIYIPPLEYMLCNLIAVQGTPTCMSVVVSLLQR